MKKISALFVSVAILFIILFIISISVSASKPKDPNCVSRCMDEYKKCVYEVRGLKVIERMDAEDECLRQRKTCIALCSEML